jgi:SIR2-like protein
MDRNWSPSDHAILSSSVHRQIVELGFPLIYTTNYDNNLERAFHLHERPFSKIASVMDISSARKDCPNIVKFHGDFSDDNSLVVTETDYFERLEFETPLDLRLRSDALGRSILFVGYSLKDLNLRLLLYKLKRTWEGTAYAKRRPQSYIFLIRPDPVQEEVLESRGISPIVSESLAPDKALPEFFGKLLDMVLRIG